MNTKTILKVVSSILGVVAITLAIITLVNYYSYANTLEKLQSVDLTLIERFELQDSRETYLYRTLRLLPWTLILSVISVLVSTLSMLFVAPKNIRKIR